MTLYLYNALWHLFRPFIGVVLTYRERRGKADAGRRIERYGRVNIAADGMSASRTAITSPKMIAANRPIWLHAVSVGESVAALRLASALTSQLPDKQFLITTNTIAGAALIAAAKMPAQLILATVWRLFSKSKAIITPLSSNLIKVQRPVWVVFYVTSLPWAPGRWRS